MVKKFIVLFFPAVFSAQYVIDNNACGIDQKNGIIVINQNIDELNASVSGSKEYFTIGTTSYYFDQAVANLEKGSTYSVKTDNAVYKAFFSDLPVIRMTTTGTIKDTPKVLGNFELLAPGQAVITSMIGVEYRGASSQSYPKKSMEIEFWLDEKGDKTQDFSPLNLFKDDAVNLQAMYNEKLRINSKTANDLWQKIHPDVYYKNKEKEARSGIVMRYADLFLNGEYRGIYALGEKVKRKFLRLKKYDAEIKGELYKGNSWDAAPNFNGLNPYNNASDYWDGFEYKHPKELIDWSTLYAFVDFVVNSDDATFRSTYSQKIDVPNMLDYFIFMNLIRAVDNRGKNLYLAKYKKGEPYFYVPWDLDATFGSFWEGSNQNVYNDLLFNGLYSRLWQDPAFRVQLSERWSELRNSVVSKEKIGEMLTQNYQDLQQNGVYLREKAVWNSFTASPGQLSYHISWIENRIAYLDGIFGEYLATEDYKKENSALVLAPNPASRFFSVSGLSVSGISEIRIIDFSGKILSEKVVNGNEPEPKISVEGWPSGVYFVVVKNGNSIRTSRLMVNNQ